MDCQKIDEFSEVDEKYLDEQIKAKLSRFEYREYENEENQEYVYEFKNTQADKNLLIVVDNEATVYYADSHSHYEFYKDDIDMLIDDVLRIFNGELKVVKFYSAERWLGDFWLATTEIVNAAEFLQEVMFPKEFLNEFKRLGGKLIETYWNGETITHKIEPFK